MSDAVASSPYAVLQERVSVARDAGESLVIRGGNSKHFYGRDCTGEPLDTATTAGVIAYEPSELVITAGAGTQLRVVEETLASQGQMLAFEPPWFDSTATLGGAVACGLSGPRRPYAGGVRDFVLGTRCLNGRGEVLTFGGQVMKNVAGYDVSRLMTGALGTLGMMLEISLKVLPLPETGMSLRKRCTFNQALLDMNQWAGRSLSLSGACYDGEHLNIRLSGKASAVKAAAGQLELDDHPGGLDYWQQLREHRLDFFRDDETPLWRLSVPSLTGMLDLSGDCLLDWGGAQRWYRTNEPADKIYALCRAVGGHATLFRGGDRTGEVFQPLTPGIAGLHQRLKQAFDPDHVFNPGRLYATL